MLSIKHFLSSILLLSFLVISLQSCDNDITILDQEDFADTDSDQIFDGDDNCTMISNPDQEDIDNDGIGDACDDDIDGDGILNIDDNCPETPNQDQADENGDGIGDACLNGDLDGDGVNNANDNCPEMANSDQGDSDGDGIGDVCDPDTDSDGDGIPNGQDNCPDMANDGQEDVDEDGIGDACDNDIDGDGILNNDDNCPEASNPDQADEDNDGIGDVCDPDSDPDGDIDEDGIANGQDNCPLTANPGQEDEDGNGIGDACDGTADTFFFNLGLNHTWTYDTTLILWEIGLRDVMNNGNFNVYTGEFENQSMYYHEGEGFVSLNFLDFMYSGASVDTQDFSFEMKLIDDNIPFGDEWQFDIQGGVFRHRYIRKKVDVLDTYTNDAGQSFNDVLVIEETYRQIFNNQIITIGSGNEYWARGIGLVEKEEPSVFGDSSLNVLEEFFID